jgi:hypothetical protein
VSGLGLYIAGFEVACSTSSWSCTAQ